MEGRPMISPIIKRCRAFAGGERGAILVEFALVLPMMLIFFAVIVEGSRMMWSYQTAIEGVRDASRYLARVAPANICSLGGGYDISVWQPDLQQIVSQTISGQVFPTDVTVSVTPGFRCDTGDFRNTPVTIGTVSAQVQIQFPFSSLLSFFGGTAPASLQTTLTDQSRIYGS
ncbi:TadE/TadG family type IV pilus assembly protein [Solirhodobacter olei]|uniref:TadE/TadG family type IV pilus assembly protein n=1 Tax=Solirhodobacter olei TaxID=2493082 RepID=UPI001F4DBFD4|nr:TadE family protein [Solirhodobacter olei]